MIKKIILSCTTMAIALPAQAELKSGWRAGVGLGYKDHRAKHATAHYAQPINEYDSTANNSRYRGMTSELTFGYDFFKDFMYYALEFNYRYSRDKAGVNYNIENASGDPLKSQQKHDHDFGLAAHVGIKVMPKMAIYGIANLRYGHFTEIFQGYSAQNAPSLLNKESKQKRWGVGGGLGVKYDLIDQWTIAGEATYDLYQKIKIRQNLETNIGSELVSSSQKPRIVNLMFKVSNTF